MKREVRSQGRSGSCMQRTLKQGLESGSPGYLDFTPCRLPRQDTTSGRGMPRPGGTVCECRCIGIASYLSRPSAPPSNSSTLHINTHIRDTAFSNPLRVCWVGHHRVIVFFFPLVRLTRARVFPPRVYIVFPARPTALTRSTRRQKQLGICAFYKQCTSRKESVRG